MDCSVIYILMLQSLWLKCFNAWYDELTTAFCTLLCVLSFFVIKWYCQEGEVYTNSKEANIMNVSQLWCVHSSCQGSEVGVRCTTLNYSWITAWNIQWSVQFYFYTISIQKHLSGCLLILLMCWVGSCTASFCKSIGHAAIVSHGHPNNTYRDWSMPMYVMYIEQLTLKVLNFWNSLRNGVGGSLTVTVA